MTTFSPPYSVSIMPRLIRLLLLVSLLTPGVTSLGQTPTYTADWESLSRHEAAPEWFANSKLGIYFHWGVYTVPAFGSEWYPFWMHVEDSWVYKHHLEKYGSHQKVGYHDFVPQFTGEHFDGDEWAELFQRAGARFAGPVAQHHDGFAMWDSEVNPWNAADMGPMKDITGELAAGLRERGMKLITTFHHARHRQRHAGEAIDPKHPPHDSHYPWNEDFATTSDDPLLKKLYGNLSEEEFNAYWFDQIKEVVDQYDPDIIWFDSWLNIIPEHLREEMCAYYLNHASKNGQEPVIAYKQVDLPTTVGVLDIEQGGKKDLSESVWMTDVTISDGSWCYTDAMGVKSADLVLRNMIDVWSKNGVVLLNVSPKADGTIPERQRKVLHEIGDWLAEYGEAVYGTRPFDIYGFGAAKADEGHFGGQSATVKYTADDVRFTVSKDGKTMYLFYLGKPEAGKRHSYKKLSPHHYPPHGEVKRVTILGTDHEVDWEMDTHACHVTLPDVPMNQIATVLKIEME